MQFYEGKKVFIAGGSKGIGRATAVALAKAGAHVVVGARGQAALDEAVAAMRGAGGADHTFGSVSFDVTDRPAVKAAAAQALEQLGGLDVLLCNSGFALPGYISEVDDDSFDAMVNVNYLGHVNVVRAFLPHFKAQKSGSICLVSSVIGFLPLYGYAAYCASKFAIVGFAEVLRMEMKEHNVDVKLFYPPTTDTPGLAVENETKPRAVWLLESDSMFSKTYTADQVAGSIVAHIAGSGFDATHGLPNKFLYHFNRHLPNVARWANDDEVRKALKKTAAEKQ